MGKGEEGVGKGYGSKVGARWRAVRAVSIRRCKQRLFAASKNPENWGKVSVATVQARRCWGARQ